jgi:serine/threonine protein kinase/uncharacterized protein YlzI (FlbEa/FlbD family)
LTAADHLPSGPVGSRVEDLREEIVDCLQRLQPQDNSNYRDQFDEIKRQLDDLKQIREKPNKEESSRQLRELFPVVDTSKLKLNKSNVLGEGGFGTVYSGVYNGEAVAVKVMKRQGYKYDESAIRELQNEVTVLHIMGKYTGIVRLFGANVEERLGDICIVLEMADGSLDDCIHSNKLQIDMSLPTKVRIALDVSRAMGAMANLGIFFRDAKPLNILIFIVGRERRIVAKLTDFGLAKMATDLASTIGGGIKGTLPYMAPELFTANSKGVIEYSFKSDVYSYGILLNEMMTEFHPYYDFEGGIVDLMRAVCGGKRPKIFYENDSAVKDDPRATVHNALKQIIKSCIQQSPNSRPRFDAVVDDLEKVYAAASSLARQGKSSVLARTAISLATMASVPQALSGGASNKSGRKELKELMVADIEFLFTKLELPDPAIAAVKENKINGKILQLAEEVADFAELGLTLNKFHAKSLKLCLDEYRESGVPLSLLPASHSEAAASAAVAAASASPGRYSALPTIDLPILSDPTSFVGKAVRLMALADDELTVLQRNHGGSNPVMKALLGERGVVLSIDKDGDVQVDINSAKYLWNPALVLVVEGAAITESIAAIVDKNKTNPAVKVGAKVRVIKTTEAEANLLQANYGGLTASMKKCLGKVGEVALIKANGDVRVVIEGESCDWCRSMVCPFTDVNPATVSRKCIPICTKGDAMTRCVSYAPSYAKDSRITCDLCKKRDINLGEFFYHCTSCKYDLCDDCSTAKVGTAVKIRASATPAEIESEQRGHGSYKPIMARTVGLSGTIATIDGDGDIAVIFDKSARSQLGDDTKGFFYNPSLVRIDGSKRNITVGTSVTLKAGVTDNTTMVGKVGKVEDIKWGDNTEMAIVNFEGTICGVDPRALDFITPGGTGSGASPQPSPTKAAGLRKGVTVRIRNVPITEAESMQKSHAGINDDMRSMLGRVGTVVKIDSDGDVYVKINERTYCWNPNLVEIMTDRYHAGKWRDQSITPTYCILEECIAHPKCCHGEGILKSDHWSCCGALTESAVGCVDVSSANEIVVGSAVMIRKVSPAEAEKLQAGYGGLTDTMKDQLGKAGKVIEMEGKVVKVRCEGLAFSWNPSLLDVSITCSAKCRAGHDMTEMTSKPAEYSGSVRCDVCRRDDIDENLFLHCSRCNFDLCKTCSTCVVGTPVIIKRDVSEADMRSLQQKHGGINEVMMKTRGRSGFIIKVDEDGDIGVMFPEDQREGLGEYKALVYNKELVQIDGAKVNPWVKGMVARIRLVTTAEATAYQSDYGGINDEMLSMMGRMGVVDGITARQVSVNVDGKVYAWNPQMVMYSDGCSDLAKGTTVKICKVKDEELERMQKDCGGSNQTMNSMMGRFGTVTQVIRGVNIKVVKVSVDGQEFSWNPFLIQISNDTMKAAATVTSETSSTDLMVRIANVGAKVAEEKQHGHGGLTEDMKAHLGKVGKIIKIDKDRDVHVQINGETYCWNPELIEDASGLPPNELTQRLQALIQKQGEEDNKFKPGDKVIIKNCSKEEATSMQKFHGGINDTMLAMLGKMGEITAIDSDGDIKVSIDGKTFCWNPAMVSKVDADAATEALLQMLAKYVAEESASETSGAKKTSPKKDGKKCSVM